MNLNDFMSKNLNLNLDIVNSFIFKTKFSNKNLEEKYQLHQSTDNKYHIMLGEIMINLGYFASLIYIIFAYYKLIFLLVIIIFWIISLILIYISHKYVKNTATKLKINYFLVFLISTALNFKANLVSIYYTNEIDERYGELIRVIIYDFVSTNLFTIIIDEGNLITHVFYFFYNLISILIAQNYSSKNYFFYLEILTSFCMSFILYIFRKAWDYKLRSLFAEKFKIEKFFLYTSDFINGLDAYHLNFKNKDLMFLNEKFIHLLVEEIEKGEEENQFYSKNDIDIGYINDNNNNSRSLSHSHSSLDSQIHSPIPNVTISGFASDLEKSNSKKLKGNFDSNYASGNDNSKSSVIDNSDRRLYSINDEYNDNDNIRLNNGDENEINIIEQDKKLKIFLEKKNKEKEICKERKEKEEKNLNKNYNKNENENENKNEENKLKKGINYNEDSKLNLEINVTKNKNDNNNNNNNNNKFSQDDIIINKENKAIDENKRYMEIANHFMSSLIPYNTFNSGDKGDISYSSKLI
jgi:hypothetical protein